MATSPLSGLVFPHRISSSVDLPDPFGPITPMRSPSDTVNEIFLNSGATPYRFASPWALIIGGNSLGLLPPLVYPEERRQGQFAPAVLVPEVRSCDAAIRRIDSRRWCRRTPLRLRSRQTRPPRRRPRACWSHWQENPHLRRRPLQFHEHPLPPGEFPQRK